MCRLLDLGLAQGHRDATSVEHPRDLRAQVVHKAVHHPAGRTGHRPQVVLALAREHPDLVAGRGIGPGEIEQRG